MKVLDEVSLEAGEIEAKLPGEEESFGVARFSDVILLLRGGPVC